MQDGRPDPRAHVTLGPTLSVGMLSGLFVPEMVLGFDFGDGRMERQLTLYSATTYRKIGDGHESFARERTRFRLS